MKRMIAYLLFSACIIIFTGCTPNYNDNSKLKLEINGKKLSLEVAKSVNKQSRGLSNRNNLGDNEGMLFIFDKSDYLQFWMKDTLIPLQIIFVKGCTIVDVQEMAIEEDPQNPKTIYRSKQPADKAIEVNPKKFSTNIVGQEIDRLCK